MTNLISHIEYLIQRHDCVIVVGLGGFVLSRNIAQIQQDGSMLPPTLRIGFNADLGFNDGLLAESLMKVNGLSYNQSLDQIDRLVKDIFSDLNKGKTVSIGSLGELKIENDVLVFNSNNTLFYHPEIWAIPSLKMKHIAYAKDIQPAVISNKRVLNTRLKYAWSGVAALFVGLFLYSSFNTTALKDAQLSGFYINSGVSEELALKMNGSSIINNNASFLDKLISEKKDAITVKDQKVTAVDNNIQEHPVFEKRYFIILGGDTEKNRAERLLQKFKQKGFKDVAIIEASGRYRIYDKSFTNKDKANIYLDSFRKSYPEFNEAWLFTSKVERHKN